MVSLGVDFGSTYTMVSVFRDGKPEVVQPDNLTFSYPSIVAYDLKKKSYIYGMPARNKIGQPNIVAFKGFKMLLNGAMSSERLKERNYDGNNTPEKITELFLKYVIQNTLKKLNETVVEHLVLGAPECWFESIQTADARSVLRDICSKIDSVKDVRIISEPINAAAYGIWCYNKMKPDNKSFNGSVLVVDYGGGTLDTAIVSIHQNKNEKLKVKSEMRSGRGENRDNEIGTAGIAYQEAVVRRAIKDATGIDETNIPTGTEFFSAVKALEDDLICNASDIEDTFETYKATQTQLAKEFLLDFMYQGDSIEINYGHLLSVYNQLIRPVLDNVLKESIEGLPNTAQIHLLPVGGFCNFVLVREQILEFCSKHFNWGMIGREDKVILLEEANREKAIAHGASLFSDNVIDLCYVAEYGIGVYAERGGKVYENYAIDYGQEYIPDEVNFATDADGNPSIMMLTGLDTFLINFSRNKKDHMPPMCPSKFFADQLNDALKKIGFQVAVGFSIDVKERLSVHIFKYNNDPAHRGISKKADETIQLSTFRECFRNTVIS